MNYSKKRVLCIGELTTLNSGLAIYNKELIQLLRSRGHEVIEFAIGNTDKEPVSDWPIILNQPMNEEEERIYSSSIHNRNGLYKFEKTCLDIKPDVVFDGRDPFCYAYQTSSPFRKCFTHAIVAPVDGVNQRPEWINYFKDADAVFTYTKFGKEVLEKEGVNVTGIAPPSISPSYYNVGKDRKEDLRYQWGLQDKLIIGNISRNQPRKFIPELMNSYRKALDKGGIDNSLLYIHTCALDIGWDIPDLIMHYGLSSRVLLTYHCVNCEHTFPSFFRELRSFCPKCRKPMARTASLSDNITDKTMRDIISLFDLYVQVSGREGYGMPQLEALSCGVPVLTVNYSAMGDFLDNEGTYSIVPSSYKYSHEIDLYDAMVNTDELADKILEHSSKKENVYLNRSTWEESLKPIADFIDVCKKGNWASPLDIKPIPPYLELPHLSNFEYAKYLITNVLQVERYLYSSVLTRLVDELNSTNTFGNNCETYLLGPRSSKGQTSHFGREEAYMYIADEREKINFWEAARNAN